MMDFRLLTFINSAHSPSLDLLMVVFTTAGLGALPQLALLLRARGQRRAADTLLLAQAAALAATLLFYWLANRARPLDVRLLLPMPAFPSFPSGHAAIALATATVWTLLGRSRAWALYMLVTGIVISRVYLGHHYPSDVAAGMVLGAATGAAVYGLREHWAMPLRAAPWLLWPQAAVVVLVTTMAYLDILPHHLLRWPLADKVLHGVLFGAVVFWLNLWLREKQLRVGLLRAPIALALPFGIALAEEVVQAWSPLRTFDLLDLASDLVGMMVCYWVSVAVLNRAARGPDTPVSPAR
jgi:membrane-associated phospholipid phosphatase/VanZ family protein